MQEREIKSIRECSGVTTELAETWASEPYNILNVEDIYGIFVSYDKDYMQVSRLLSVSKELLNQIITEAQALIGEERLSELETPLPVDEWGFGALYPDDAAGSEDSPD